MKLQLLVAPGLFLQHFLLIVKNALLGITALIVLQELLHLVLVGIFQLEEPARVLNVLLVVRAQDMRMLALAQKAISHLQDKVLVPSAQLATTAHQEFATPVQELIK